MFYTRKYELIYTVNSAVVTRIFTSYTLAEAAYQMLKRKPQVYTALSLNEVYVQV